MKYAHNRTACIAGVLRLPLRGKARPSRLIGAGRRPDLSGADVLEGELELRAGGEETRFTAGQGFAEKAGQEMQVVNVGATKARMVVTFVLPSGTELTTPAGTSSAPAPTVVSRHQQSFTSHSGPFDLVQLVQDFAPGAQTPPHSHGGTGQVTVLEGEFELRTSGGTSRFRAGQGFTETANESMQLTNVATGAARMVVAFVLPKGAELTTARGAVEMAATGPRDSAEWAARAIALVSLGLCLLQLSRKDPERRAFDRERAAGAEGWSIT